MPHPLQVQQAKTRGVTLIELLVVVAVVAILAGLAWPAYGTYLARAQRAQAQAQLMEAAQFLERFYAARATYDGATLPARLAVSPPGASAGVARYALSLVSDDSSYTLTAAPQGEPDACGSLVLRHTGAKSVLGVGARVEDCWR